MHLRNTGETQALAEASSLSMLVAEHHLSAAIKTSLRKCGMEAVPPKREWLAPSPSSAGFAILYKDSESHLSLASPGVSHCSSIGPELCGGNIANDEIIVRNDVTVGHFEHR